MRVIGIGVDKRSPCLRKVTFPSPTTDVLDSMAASHSFETESAEYRDQLIVTSPSTSKNYEHIIRGPNFVRGVAIIWWGVTSRVHHILILLAIAYLQVILSTICIEISDENGHCTLHHRLSSPQPSFPKQAGSLSCEVSVGHLVGHVFEVDSPSQNECICWMVIIVFFSIWLHKSHNILNRELFSRR